MRAWMRLLAVLIALMWANASPRSLETRVDDRLDALDGENLVIGRRSFCLPEFEDDEPGLAEPPTAKVPSEPLPSKIPAEFVYSSHTTATVNIHSARGPPSRLA